MTRPNLATSLRRRVEHRSMDRFDQLPPELRQWLSQASLPWSIRSVIRIWKRAEKQGCRAQILARLDRAERTTLRRDGPRIWGRDYPTPE